MILHYFLSVYALLNLVHAIMNLSCDISFLNLSVNNYYLVIGSYSLCLALCQAYKESATGLNDVE